MKKITYKQAMKTSCDCGKFYVGGWQGNKKLGQPLFVGVVCPIVKSGIRLTESHTKDICFAPERIRREG